MLELAQTVIRVTGSTSEIVFEALPIDDPQIRRPDITRARQVLGWEPEIDLEEGPDALADGARPGAGRGLSVRRVGVIVAVARWRRSSLRPRGPPHGVAVPARRHLRRGADALRPGRPDVRRAQAAARAGDAAEPLLGRPVRRREDAAGARRPTRPTRRTTGTLYDRTVQLRAASTASTCSSRSTARRAGRTAARRRTSRRRSRDRPAQLRLRRGEALQRHVHGRPTGRLAARRCSEWLAWNEPNNPLFLAPQYEVAARRG